MVAGGRGGVTLRPGQQRPLPGGKQAGPQALAAQRQIASAAPDPVPMDDVASDIIEKELTGPDAFVWSNYSTTVVPGRKVNGKTFDMKLAGDAVVGVWLRDVRLNFGIQENKFQKGQYQCTVGLSYKYSRNELEFAKTGHEFFIQQVKSHIEVINDALGLEGTKRWKADEVVGEEDERKIFVKPMYKYSKEDLKDGHLYDYDHEAYQKELQALAQNGVDPQAQGVAFDHGDVSGVPAAGMDGTGDVPMDGSAAAALGDGQETLASFGVQDTNMAGAVDQGIQRLERWDTKGNFREPFRNMIIDLVRDMKKFRFEVLKPGSKDTFEPKRVPLDFYLSQKRPCDILYIIDGAYIDMSTKKVTIKGYTNFIQVKEGKDAQVSGRSCKGRTAPPPEDGTMDASGREADPRNPKRARH